MGAVIRDLEIRLVLLVAIVVLGSEIDVFMVNFLYVNPISFKVSLVNWSGNIFDY